MAIYRYKSINPKIANKLIQKLEKTNNANDVYRIVKRYLGTLTLPSEFDFGIYYGYVTFNNGKQIFEIHDYYQNCKPLKVPYFIIKNYYQSKLLSLIPQSYLNYK